MATDPNTELSCRPRPASETVGCGRLLRRAPAKLNLALRVGGRRADGFHGVDSVVARVTLYDELTFRPRTDGQVRLECAGADCGPARDNLVHRAATELASRTGGVDARLVKRVPPGSGLGGGSSDAAATLLALDELLGLRLPAERMARMAATWGSDVPLFLAGPTVRMRGRGERIDPVDMHPFWAVLVVPDLICPTADVYRAFDELAGDAPKTPPEPDVARFALPPSRWGSALANDLQPAAVRACPALGPEIDRLAAAAGRAVYLTGSGSALFIPADDEPAAEAVAGTLPGDLRRRCRIVSLNPW